MDLATQFRSEIDRFLEKTGMAPTAFGQAAVNDASFVFDVRAGRSPRLQTAQKALDYIASHANGSERRGSET